MGGVGIVGPENFGMCGVGPENFGVGSMGQTKMTCVKNNGMGLNVVLFKHTL